LAAAAGVVVPMMSGRALGHTGGTLDKLESIPGFRTDLSSDEFQRQLAELGLCFIGQTDQFARPTASFTRCATSPARWNRFR